jgi:hypothetical protein
MPKPKYGPHPLVEKLTTGKGEAGTVKLLGYFGSASDGVVKIYPNLDDLSVYYQIREDDIVHVEDAATDTLPHGGSTIWVKASALVERCTSRRVSMEARFLAGEIAAYMTKGPAAIYRSLAAQQAIVPETGACVGGSIWPCSVVYGYCLASNDMPCANTEQYWCPGNVPTGDTCVFTCAGWTCGPPCYSVQCPWTQWRFCTQGCQTVARPGCGVISAFCPRAASD